MDYLKQSDHVELLTRNPEIIWNRRVRDTELDKFKQVIEKKYNITFDNYWDLQKWSVDYFQDFWKEIWIYFNIVTSQQYKEVFVKTGHGFLDCVWFKGARFNLAENILRYRDDRIGLICIDECKNKETITFSEIFEQVKLYTSAFRKLGLTKGDRVSYFMSNRKEALFTLLATASIGAIWGGPQNYYGSKFISRIFKMINPKFILSMDYFVEDGKECCALDVLPIIVKDIPSLQKVIIVPTKEDTVRSKILHIPKSIFLEDFLKFGRRSDGTVPELVFEQLPFDHPTTINFTSGTTGLPKGVVHAAGSLICQMRDFSLHLNLNIGDVFYMRGYVGWAVWDYHIPCLALGVTLLLFDGSPVSVANDISIWEIFAQNRVTCAFFPAMYAEIFERRNLIPGPKTDLSSLKIMTFGACSLRRRNYQFLQSKVKRELVILSWYGASEVFGVFCGFDFNTPLYMGELQGPALGVDLHCFDENGRSVVGQRGNLVIASPNPALPCNLWNDNNHKDLQEYYLNKYKGVWSQNDECLFNPDSKGIIIIGRSDDVLKQDGERFGPTDIYHLIGEIEELDDYICVSQRRRDDETRAVLFVKLKKGYLLTLLLKEKITDSILSEMSEECVPRAIIEVPDIPYNLNNKRMESVVRKIIATNKIPDISNIRNPDSLQHYCDIPEIINYN